MPILLRDKLWIEENNTELSGAYILIDCSDINRLTQLNVTHREGYVIIISSSYSHCGEAHFLELSYKLVTKNIESQYYNNDRCWGEKEW